MDTDLPTFIDSSPEAYELYQYFSELNPNIKDFPGETLPIESIEVLIDSLSICFQDPDQKKLSLNDVEGLLNALVTLIIHIRSERLAGLVEQYTDKILSSISSKQPVFHSIQLQSLYNLFYGLLRMDDLASIVYIGMLKFAHRTNLIEHVPHELSLVQGWIEMWRLPLEKVQLLYRCLYDALLVHGDRKDASQVMISLLTSYTETSADSDQAKVDATRCIGDAIKDPDVFLFDHFKTLPPVRSLTGTPVEKLLDIFIQGRLKDFTQFCRDEPECLVSMSVEEAECRHKMRLLTLMSMCEEQKQLTFNALKEELRMEEEDIEPFIIDALRGKVIQARIDQVQRVVNVSTISQRTFNEADWSHLHDRLKTWFDNLEKVRIQIREIVYPIDLE